MENKSKTNVFTEEGRILQVEYAIKNVSKAGTILGMVCTDGILLLGIKKNVSNNKEKIYKIKPYTFCAVSGLFSDCQQIIKNSRIFAENSFESLGFYHSTKAIASSIGATLQKLTQKGGERPLGVTALFAGDGMLVSADPSGTVTRWEAVCFGENEEFINKEFRNVFVERFNLEIATKKILEIVANASEFNKDNADRIELLHLKQNEFKFMENDSVKDLIVNIKSSN